MLHDEHPTIRKKLASLNVISDPKITNIEVTELKLFIFQDIQQEFGVKPKNLQINTLMSLVKKWHSFGWDMGRFLVHEDVMYKVLD